MTKAKMFTEITVTDPDTGGEVEVSMFKHENGGIFGIDSSYIDQVLPEEGEISIPDPFISDDLIEELQGLRNNPNATATDIMNLNRKLLKRETVLLEGV